MRKLPQQAQKQRGMALFQVLLMVAIISVLLIIMSKQTQSTVQQAQLLQDRVERELALSSAAAYVDSLLLSNDWLISRNDPQSPLHQINFYGEPHLIPLPQRAAYGALGPEVTLQLQNEASLLDLNFRTNDIEPLLLQLGKSPLQARQMVEELRSFLRAPEQIYFQNVADLAHLESWTVEDVAMLRNLTSVSAPIFNPVWMPNELLSVLLTPEQAATIRSLRKSNESSAGLLQDFFGEMDAADTGIFPGIAQRMRLTDESSGLELYREVDYRPRHPSPLRLYAKYFQQE